MAVWRMRPPNVRQTKNTCWAAATSSWSRVTGGIPNWMRVDDVVSEFQSWSPDPVQADRSLQTPAGWIQFAGTHGLKMEEILIRQLVEVDGRWVYRAPIPSSGIRSVRSNDLSVAHFANKLRSSHVIVVLPPGDGIGVAHVVVVYGADTHRVYFMDPNAPWEQDKLRERARYEDFGQWGGASRYLLIWKE